MDGILFPRGVPEGRENLSAYKARGGYEALVTALRSSPEAVIGAVADAGLRGRGGAGVSSGKKWQLTREAPEQPHYRGMNGGETDPGSKKTGCCWKTCRTWCSKARFSRPTPSAPRKFIFTSTRATTRRRKAFKMLSLKPKARRIWAKIFSAAASAWKSN